MVWRCRCADIPKASLKHILRRSTQNPTGVHPQSMETMFTSSQRTHPHPTRDDDDYVMYSFSVFSHHHATESTTDDKYLTWLPVSFSPNKTLKVLMQVDSAATCNTLLSSIYRKMSETAPLQPSHAKIFPYSGNVIYPLGKVNLACEEYLSCQYITVTSVSRYSDPGDVWCWFTICSSQMVNTTAYTIALWMHAGGC